MGESPIGRYRIVVDERPPRGDLYELEQITTYRVVDTRSNQVALTFEGRFSARLSADTGLWADETASGALDVALTPDGRAVLVRYADGRKETTALPE